MKCLFAAAAAVCVLFAGAPASALASRTLPPSAPPPSAFATSMSRWPRAMSPRPEASARAPPTWAGRRRSARWGSTISARICSASPLRPTRASPAAAPTPISCNPAILIYEPQADGSLQLVAVENLVFESAWRAAGNDSPPTFHGRPYEHMVDDPATTIDEAHMFEPHYDRHVWVFRDNPSGVFAPFNPNVTCPSDMAAAGHGGHAGH